jgi:tetratricopeptide (TPR) repeat protein/predicted Ser/Thr protein kinase
MPKLVYCPACRKSYLVPRKKLGAGQECVRCGLVFNLGEDQIDTGKPDATPREADAGPGGDGDSSVPRKLGRFEIRERLGAGAYGTVYRAYDRMLERDVALKVPLSAALATPEAQARFLREPKAAARLSHPHIVPIYDAGFDGRHYFIAYELIAGRTLDQAAREGLDREQSVRIVQQLAEALQYAHGRGIVHRDVKPSNVLLDEQGAPHLTDFGLARSEQAVEKLTRDGAYLGTPAYMSPEQARSGAGPVGPASDQYSLGVVLYELLCGRTPFVGPPLPLIFQIRERDPPPLTSLECSVPEDLQTICLKCLGKTPQDRYPDCAALAADLERWRRHEPIVARRPSWAYRARKLMRRHPIGSAATTAAAVLIVAALVGAGWARGRRADEVARLQRAGDDLASTAPAQAIEVYQQAIGLARAWPRLAKLEAELTRKSTELAAPIAAAERFDRFQRMAARAQAMTPLGPDEPAAVAVNGRLIETCEDALAEYGVLDRRNWLAHSDARLLDSERRGQLLADIAAVQALYFDTQERGLIRGADLTGAGFQLAAGTSAQFALPRIHTVYEASPAAVAGLLVDDKLAAIDDVEVFGLPDDDSVLDRIKGAPGSDVRLSVLRGGELAPREFRVRRDQEGRVGVGLLRFRSLAAGRIRESSPAYQAGLRMGDLLLTVDGAPAEGEIRREGTQGTVIPFVGWYLSWSESSGPRSLSVLAPGGRVPRRLEIPWSDAAREQLVRNHAGKLTHDMRLLRGAFASAQWKPEFPAEWNRQFQGLRDKLRIADPALPIAEQMVGYFHTEFGWPVELLRSAAESDGQELGHYYAGLQLQGIGDYDGAIAEFRLELQRNPRHADSARLIASCLSTRRRWDEAISAWTLFVALRPQTAQGYWWRGEAYRQSKQTGPAQRDLHKALQLDPELTEAKAALDELQKSLADAPPPT